MTKIKYNECPICKSKNINKFIDSKDFSTSSEDYTIFICNDCSFAFTQDVPDENSIGKYYKSEEYISHSDTKKGLFFKIYHIVRNYMLKNKQKIVEKYSGQKTGKILDIGTGTGYFINKMKQHGWSVAGIEQDDDARNFGKSNFNLDVFDKKKLFEFDDNYFDVITMWHVLEHVHRYNEYLNQIKKILKPNGKLIIAVPNYTSYDAKHYKKYWAAYDLPIHLWHFSPKSIKILLNNYNFNLIKKKGMPFDSFYVSILSEKYKKAPFGMIKGLFFGLLSLISAWGNINNYSSIIYIFDNKK